MTRSALFITAAIAALAAPAAAQRLGAGATMIGNDSAIPHCAASLGTVSLVEEKKAATLDGAFPPQLAAFMALARARQGGGEDVDPIPLLKLLVACSGCFSVVGRGAGFNAVQRERELANAGQVTDSATGNAATLAPSDYVLVAQVVYANGNAGGAGGLLGGLGGGGGGGGFGGAASRTRAVQTMLTSTAVKTGVQTAVATGPTRKKDINWAAGGLARLAIGGLAGHQNTDLAKITAAAILDAFNKLVPEITAAPRPQPR